MDADRSMVRSNNSRSNVAKEIRSSFTVRDDIHWAKEKAFEDFYEVGKLLGKGSTAVVFKCERKGTGKAWAVKIIEKNANEKAVYTEIGRH